MIGKVISNKDHKRASTMDQAPKPVRASYWNIKSDSTQLPTTIGTTDHNCPSSSPNSFFNILAEFKGVFLGMARSPTRKQYKQEKMMMENDKIGWVKAKQTPHINIYIYIFHLCQTFREAILILFFHSFLAVTFE